MNTWDGKERRVRHNVAIRKLVIRAKEKYKNFFEDHYKYSYDEPVEELGLDKELIDQLLEDYVAQVIKSTYQFKNYIDNIASKKESDVDYLKEFHELAHKNLGVARNLRVKDAEKVLKDMMNHNDLEVLKSCNLALKSSAILLKPECAYNTMKLIEVKNKL